MRPGRIPLHLVLAIAAFCSSPVAAAAPAARDEEGALSAALSQGADGPFRRFYAERGYRPLWVVDGRIGPQAGALIDFLESADADGLRPSAYDVDGLRAAVAAAKGGDPERLARAELKLSAAFARYVRDLRKPGRAKMAYADRALKPKRLKPDAVLRMAAFPKSFGDYVADMGWMSPHYVRLRALAVQAHKTGLSEEGERRLRLNLDRARLLPGPWTRHVEVDASSGRLWYYEAGRQVGTMRVVVGAAKTQTPMLAGTLRWAILNPYWNVPDYLVRDSVAPKVMAGRTLASLRMEALSDWSATPRRLDPATLDWAAIAAGKQDLRLRELPGAGNSMGRVKFVFPNDEGIYLHDTPDRALLRKDDRHFSNGCIRLEDAPALGRWLLQKPIRAVSKEPEQAVPLPVPVPVYLTYLTATQTDAGPAFREDVYNRDR